jgi:DNA-binding NtrC family response regulator
MQDELDSLRQSTQRAVIRRFAKLIEEQALARALLRGRTGTYRVMSGTYLEDPVIADSYGTENRVVGSCRAASPHQFLLEIAIMAETLLVGDSAHIHDILRQCAMLGPRERNALILGETGTGKTLVARELHRRSRRRDKPFKRIASGELLNAQLLQATLAGAREGAYSDLTSDRLGILRAAEGGTVLWDDIQDLPLPVQPYLLDVIERAPIHALGEERDYFVPNVRWLFGSQRPLCELVATGKMQRDLASRIGRRTIRLLPLREHPEDIATLVPHSLASIAALEALPPLRCSERALAALMRAPWPDNVRELEDALSDALIEAAFESAPCIELRHLSEDLRAPVRLANARQKFRASRDELHDALEANRWVVARVARALGVTEHTIRRYMKAMGLGRPEAA